MVTISVAILLIKGKGLLESRKAEISNEALPGATLVTVSVVDPIQGIMRDRESYLAQVVSEKSIKLSTKLTGYIKNVYVDESQKVRKGDVLVQLDEIELQSSIKALEATLQVQYNDLELAKSIYMRNMKLFKVGGLAKEKLDISKVSMQAKEVVIENSMQRIEQLKHQLSYLKIVAPFDGVIDNILLHEGDLAAAGKPILGMSSGEKKLIFSYVPKNTPIKKDQSVWTEDKKIGHIRSIYTVAQNGLTNAEVKLAAKIDLPIGSNMNIEVLTRETEGCILPDDTILYKKEGTFVMVYDKEKFRPLQVNIEMEDDNHLLISPCPSTSVAQGSEVKLAQLPALENVQVIKAKHE